MNRIGQRWSEQDVRILKERVSKKVAVPKIADELGRCQKGVRSKGYSLGLKFSKQTQLKQRLDLNLLWSGQANAKTKSDTLLGLIIIEADRP